MLKKLKKVTEKVVIVKNGDFSLYKITENNYKVL